MACGVALSARGLDGGREEALRVQAIEKTSAREEGVKSRMAGRRVASSERAREDRGMPPRICTYMHEYVYRNIRLFV